MKMDRAHVLNSAPLDDLIVVLLRQYKRLLAERGISLTENDIQSLAHQMAQGASLDDRAQSIRKALIDIVEESLSVLSGWNLTFEQALKTPMSDMPGWETTAEFLEIANEKSNAELRISSASTLVTALGDLRYGNLLLALLAHDTNELEAVVARRILLKISGVSHSAPDWLAQIRSWLDKAN